MPFSKNIIQDKELSIQIFKDGFSFCTNIARPFFRFDSHKLEQGEALQNLIETYSYLESEKIKGIHFNHFSTFVPKTLYNPKQKETYLNYNIILSKGWTIAEKDTQDNKIKILYPVNKEIEETLKYYFKKISFTHYSQILYDLSIGVKNEENSIVMNLNMQDIQFDLLVFKGKDLLIYNSYPYKNEDSFLYFILAVADNLSLSPEDFDIVFFGKYSRYKKYYLALETYHNKITFSDQGAVVMFDEREHPAPYFLNLFE